MFYKFIDLKPIESLNELHSSVTVDIELFAFTNYHNFHG